MQSQVHYSQRLLNLTFESKPSVDRSENVAAVDKCAVARKSFEFASRSKSAACLGTERLHHSVHNTKKLGMYKVSEHGWGCNPLLAGAAAAATEVRGAPAKSRLGDGDGVVIVDHGSRRAQSNAMLHEFVKMYKEETGCEVVEAAHMELAVPTIADAFDQCVEQGATRIIVSPYFLFPGRHWDKDIPALAAEAAKKHPLVSYLVTAPIGLQKLMVTVIQDRMEYCLSQVAGEVAECDMCKGSGRCKQLTTPSSHSTSNALASLVRNLIPP